MRGNSHDRSDDVDDDQFVNSVPVTNSQKFSLYVNKKEKLFSFKKFAILNKKKYWNMFTLKSKAGHCWLSLFQTLLEQTVTYVHKMSIQRNPKAKSQKI